MGIEIDRGRYRLEEDPAVYPGEADDAKEVGTFGVEKGRTGRREGVGCP